MTSSKSHVGFARETEDLAGDFHDTYPEENNWVVTFHFYSYLHYVEELLKRYGYSQKSHKQRKENIEECGKFDRKVYKIYRFLYDTSRDARYECVEIDDSSVEHCKEKLDEGKEVLGFTDGGGSTKYSV